MTKTPKSIAIVGGGTAGFVSALILKKRFPHLTVDVIRSTRIGIIGVGEGSTEHWSDFMRYMEFTPAQIIKECDATFKGGIMFQNWGVPDYYHSIHDTLNVSKGLYPYVYASLIGENKGPKSLTSRLHWENKINNWFIRNPDRAPSNQYHFNTNKLNEFLTSNCRKLGINIFDDEINDFDISEAGDITTLHGTKQKYNYDFYIDCTGFKKVLISKLGAKWQSYSKYLKMNSAIAFPTGDTDNYNMWTIARGMDAGWLFRIPVWGRHGNGYIYNSNYIDADGAKAEVEKMYGHEIEIGKQISFDPGALDRVWINNCCAIGLSASFVEPLEASSIGSSIQQAFLLMHRLPCYDQNVIDSYNESVTDILTNIRDFVALHYVTKRQDTPFWQDVQKLELPDTLQTRLERWRNKMPIHEDFNRESRYILFRDAHYLFILNGLELFNNESIKAEYEMQDIKTKLLADQIVRDFKLQEDTVSTTTHKEFLRLIRSHG